MRGNRSFLNSHSISFIPLHLLKFTHERSPWRICLFLTCLSLPLPLPPAPPPALGIQRNCGKRGKKNIFNSTMYHRSHLFGSIGNKAQPLSTVWDSLITLSSTQLRKKPQDTCPTCLCGIILPPFLQNLFCKDKSLPTLLPMPPALGFLWPDFRAVLDERNCPLEASNPLGWL